MIDTKPKHIAYVSAKTATIHNVNGNCFKAVKMICLFVICLFLHYLVIKDMKYSTIVRQPAPAVRHSVLITICMLFPSLIYYVYHLRIQYIMIKRKCQ